ncbi:MAG: O-antigen ligase family protein [Acidimicrobiia bacterium]|nr:O-antigen ligase family protein [Acidimicrobiia bacterium]
MTLPVQAPAPFGAPTLDRAVPTRTTAALTQPGLTERALTVLTTFVFLHQIPNVWLQTRAETVADTSNPLLVVVMLALIGLAFARVAGSVDHLITMFRLETTLYLFAGLTFASTFWSADPAATMRRSIVFVAVTLFGSYLVMRFSLDQIIRLLAAMFVLSAAVNLFFVLGLPQYGLDAAGRWTGVFSQKNALGYTAALGLPTLVVAARAWRPGRLVFYPTAAAQIALLLGSESKTMLVAALGPTCLMAVYHLFRSRKTLRGAVMLSLGGSAVFTLAFATANIGLLARWLDKDVTLTGRVPLWENLIPIALERPLLGHGFGATFAGYFSPIHEVWIQNLWNPSHAHNALLQIWLEMGMIAVVLFLILYTRALTRAIKIVAIVPGTVGLWPLALLTTTLLVSITESGMSAEPMGWMMFVVAVLSVSLHLMYRAELGLSNDLREATAANAQERRSRHR